VAIVLAGVPLTAAAQDPGVGPSAHHEAERIIAAELAMHDALNRLSALGAQPPTGLLDTVRQELAVAAAQYSFRQGARQEELRLYEVAGYASVEAAVIPLLPPEFRSSFEDTVSAMHSLYILAGIDQYYLVNVHFNHAHTDTEPLTTLRSYYDEAFRRYGVDPSYLASINFIESNFGRVKDNSSAGAQGPMQFLPSTWTEYGQGGDIHNSHDAILAAARYLVHNGAPYNMRNAIFQYNHDFDYVDSVESFARAYRENPGWLDRMYYWNTFG
jgi:hypothetical protein